ncbi:MAG: class I SAM-dependent methyltransferase [Halolamina sp.]
MKKSREEHAARFSEKAAEYDDSKSEAYHTCADLVVEHAAPNRTDTVVDLATGTGAIALALADDAEAVVGRDISEGMLTEARRKVEAGDVDPDAVSFDEGSFRAPNYDGPADVVTTNFALHHLADDEKRAAVETIADLGHRTPSRAADVGPRRVVLGDVMFFGDPDPDAPFYDPEVDDPATVGTLVDAFTDVGYAVTAVERVHDQVGVLVAERVVAPGQE